MVDPSANPGASLTQLPPRPEEAPVTNPEPQPGPPQSSSLLAETIKTLTLAAIIYLLMSGAFQSYEVRGTSMQNTLVQGQYVIVSKAAFWRLDLRCLLFLIDSNQVTCLGGSGHQLFGGPQRGDIIVLHSPSTEGYALIKRVIGLPGEKVSIQGGQVWIDDRLLAEPYIREPAQYEMAAAVIPPGSYFVLGDNRNNSNDSHVFGMVPGGVIIGKTVLRYWPPSAWGANLSPGPRLQ